MSKKQSGYIYFEILGMTIFVVGLIVGLVYIIIYYTNISDKYSRWESDCRSSNGLVVKTSSTRVECYINNKKVVLPGWEGY